MNNGWIKLYRKLLTSLVFQNEKGLKVWIWCLLKANHKEKTILLGRQKLKIKEGAFVMGSKKASEFLGMAKSTIWYWLEFLEKEGEVELKKTNKYTIVKIKNWDKYQVGLKLGGGKSEQVELKKDGKYTINKPKITKENQQVGLKSDSNKDASWTQIGTNKNDIRMNVDTKVSSEQSSQWDFQKELEKLKTSKRRDLQIIHLYWLFKGYQFDNKDKFQRALKRDLRAAGNLKGYSDAEIENTMNWLFEKTNIKFTLETVHKFIDENLANLEPIKK